MVRRDFREEDAIEIDRIWREHHKDSFSVPDRNNILVDSVIEHEGKVIAYGQVRILAEAMMILDLGISESDRVRAIKLLMLEAFRVVSGSKIDSLYAFIEDPDFAKLIIKHFDFFQVDHKESRLVKEFK